MKNKLNINMLYKSFGLLLIFLFSLELVNLYAARPILRFYSMYLFVLIMLITLTWIVLYKRKNLNIKYNIIALFVIFATIVTMFFLWWPISTDQNQKIDSNFFQVDSSSGDIIHRVPKSDKVLIIFTGAKVDPLAMYYLAENNININVVIIKSPHNMALLSLKAADKYIEEFSDISVLGYSLGGTAATRVAQQNPKVKNLFLLASYSDIDLRSTNLNVYQYLGENDTVINIENVDKYKNNYPQKHTKKTINEFNHSSFALLDRLVENDSPYLNPDFNYRKSQIDGLAQEISRTIAD
jgi:hypothetical protein